MMFNSLLGSSGVKLTNLESPKTALPHLVSSLQMSLTPTSYPSNLELAAFDLMLRLPNLLIHFHSAISVSLSYGRRSVRSNLMPLALTVSHLDSLK